MAQKLVLCPQVSEYAVVIWTKFKEFHAWDECIHEFIQIVKQMNMMHIVPIVAIVVPEQMMLENNATGSINSIWIVNNYVNLNADWTVY